MLLQVLVGVLCVIVWYIYSGYLWVLRLALKAAGIRRRTEVGAASYEPSVTVLVTAHNERNTIGQRLENLLAQDYPAHALEILVASDGSTDGMEHVVAAFRDPRILLFRSPSQMGKTATQNAALGQARGEIIIFSDASARFAPEFVKKMAQAFADPAVGAADGRLLLENAKGNTIAESQGYYWRYELKIRDAESRLGILAVASGCCLGVRKALIREMDPSVGEDCIVPLDVVAQGHKVVHVPAALAFDQMESTSEREFRARVRMTLRNWRGTWSRAELLNPYRHFGIAFGLWSHKILRWISPFFLLALAICANVSALNGDGKAVQFVAAAIDGFAFAALLGFLGERAGFRVPFMGAAYSFLLANAGFLVGVCRALIGHSIKVYRK